VIVAGRSARTPNGITRSCGTGRELLQAPVQDRRFPHELPHQTSFVIYGGSIGRMRMSISRGSKCRILDGDATTMTPINRMAWRGKSITKEGARS